MDTTHREREGGKEGSRAEERRGGGLLLLPLAQSRHRTPASHFSLSISFRLLLLSFYPSKNPPPIHLYILHPSTYPPIHPPSIHLSIYTSSIRPSTHPPLHATSISPKNRVKRHFPSGIHAKQLLAWLFPVYASPITRHIYMYRSGFVLQLIGILSMFIGRVRN